MKGRGFLLLAVLACLGCGNNVPAFLEPIDGSCLLIMGQDNETIAGYLADDTLVRPAGYTTNTNTRNEGLLGPADWGAGILDTPALLSWDDVESPCLVVGYWASPRDLVLVHQGARDRQLREMAAYFKEIEIPVFLRIAYEFNGAHNGYDPEDYRLAFRYIVDLLREEGVKNCVSVWQSDGQASEEDLADYYPGDDYVGWCAYSHFHNTGEEMLEFARKRGKPVMIAESSPVGFDLEESPASVWYSWFYGIFEHICHHPEIKAFCYINTDWPSQYLWQNSSFFNTTDARIETSEPAFKELWNAEFTGENADRWLVGGESLSVLQGWPPEE